MNARKGNLTQLSKHLDEEMLTTAFGENPFDKLKVNKDLK